MTWTGLGWILSNVLFFLTGAIKNWYGEAHSWYDQFGILSHPSPKGTGKLVMWRRPTYSVNFQLGNRLSLNGLCNRSMQGSLVFKKLPVQTRRFWMDIFPPWMVWLQMQSANGRCLQRRPIVRQETVLTSPLLNIVGWRIFCSNGEFF